MEFLFPISGWNPALQVTLMNYCQSERILFRLSSSQQVKEKNECFLERKNYSA
jgi:hypothetical protein